MEDNLEDSEVDQSKKTWKLIGISSLILLVSFFIPGVNIIAITLGLPILGFLLLIFSGIYYKEGKKTSAKLALITGIICFIIYGTCWGFLFYGSQL